MNYPKLTALLGFATLELHAGVLGTGKPYAKLSLEDLEAIEKALTEKENTGEVEELQQKLTETQAEASAYEKMIAETAQSVDKALKIAGLEKKESMTQSIELLGEKCKEYGESKDRHSLAENNGNDTDANGLIEGYLDPNDAHNQLLKGII